MCAVNSSADFDLVSAKVRRCLPESTPVSGNDFFGRTFQWTLVDLADPSGSTATWRTVRQKVRQSFPLRTFSRELADFLPGGYCPLRIKSAAEKCPPRTLFATDKVR